MKEASVLQLKKKYDNTLFTNINNKQIWSTILAFLKNGRNEKRTFMILTKQIRVHSYSDAHLLSAYAQFWQLIQAPHSTLSDAIQILMEDPFGFFIFDSPCPVPLGDRIGRVTWEAPEMPSRCRTNETTSIVRVELSKTSFPFTRAIREEFFPSDTVVHYDYSNQQLEVRRWNQFWETYLSMYHTVHLPVIFYVKKPEGGEAYFFHLPTGFQYFHICNTYNLRTCKLQMIFKEYYNPKYSLQVSIDLHTNQDPVEFTLLDGKQYKFKNVNYLQKI